MPRLVRLSAEVPSDELRVWWDDTELGDGLHVSGPGSLQRYALAILDGPRLQARGDVGFAERSEIERRHLVRGRSPLEELEAAGYDPTTVVLTIRRKGSVGHGAVVTDDLRARLEEAQASVAALVAALGAVEGSKGVYLLDEAERDAVMEASTAAAEAVASALSLATVGSPVEAADDASPAVPGPGVSSPRVPRFEDFDKVPVLRWEDVEGDGSQMNLMDKGEMVGEVYETEQGWRWRCRTSDFRSTEDSERQARDALVESHCTRLANDARELMRTERVRADRAEEALRSFRADEGERLARERG